MIGPDQAAACFAALGDATRLKLVAHLCSDGPLPIVKLTEGTRITRQAVTKHLRTLEIAGLVHSSRVGRELVWGLKPGQVEGVRVYLDQISAQWDQALGRLRAYLS